QPQAEMDPLTLECPAERRAHVVVLAFDDAEPPDLFGPTELGLGAFHQVYRPGQMAIAHVLKLSRSGGFLGGILPKRLEQAEAHLSFMALDKHQRLVDELAQRVQHRLSWCAIVTA